MRPNRSTILAAAAACLLGAACTADDSPPAMSLTLRSELIDDGRLAVPRGTDVGTILALEGRDADGGPVTLDADAIKWSASEPAILWLKPLGTACIVMGVADWFDAVPADDDAGTDDGGADAMAAQIYAMEPTTLVTARYLDAEASVEVSVAINLEGTWRIATAGVTDVVTIAQSGRKLSIVGTNASAGNVRGDRIALMKDGLMLEGTLADRASATGTLGSIVWEAKKDP